MITFSSPTQPPHPLASPSGLPAPAPALPFPKMFFLGTSGEPLEIQSLGSVAGGGRVGQLHLELTSPLSPEPEEAGKQETNSLDIKLWKRHWKSHQPGLPAERKWGLQPGYPIHRPSAPCLADTARSQGRIYGMAVPEGGFVPKEHLAMSEDIFWLSRLGWEGSLGIQWVQAGAARNIYIAQDSLHSTNRLPKMSAEPSLRNPVPQRADAGGSSA